MTVSLTESRLRIVLGYGALASYPQGGGLWTLFLQYLLGLSALGHEVFWLELLRSTGDRVVDHRRIATFFRRFRHYGFDQRCALLLFDNELPVEEWSLSLAVAYGMDAYQIREIAQSADLLWNFCLALRGPLLSLFRRRVLIDLDPGVVQVSALKYDLDIDDHQVLFTVGGKIHGPDCQVPTLGLTWHPFTPIVYFPIWTPAPDPGPQAPFSSVVHWNWGELWLEDRVLSTAKRDAYLRYAELPRRAGRPFELATVMYPDDGTKDLEIMRTEGWGLANPHRAAGSVSSYRRYISSSRAEIACPKPIFRELRSGWFSDRSVCYLASARPVLAEDTGFSDYLPTGLGLVAFHNLEEAVAGAADIDAQYDKHMRSARELAHAYFDSQRTLPAMLSRSGW